MPDAANSSQAAATVRSGIAVSATEMCMLVVIDRESVVAATKFALCRTDWCKRYDERLLEAYKDNIWPMGADFDPHWCPVLSLDTRLAGIPES